MKEMFIEKPLLRGWVLCQYWPSEIILKHPSRKRGIYLKAPWYRHQDKTRWERFDGEFVLADKVNPKNERGFRLGSIRDWKDVRKYTRRFTYTSRTGAMQTAYLKAYRERTRQVYWWLRWLPFAGTDEDGITIEFSEEMGSERGTWKGGVIGTSASMYEGETVKDTIDRFLDEAQENHRWDR